MKESGWPSIRIAWKLEYPHAKSLSEGGIRYPSFDKNKMNVSHAQLIDKIKQRQFRNLANHRKSVIKNEGIWLAKYQNCLET